MIAEIRLRQYRSYLDRTFKLSPGVNIVIGPNGSGKTNLLESIMVACFSKSYRAPDTELVMHNCSWARVDALLMNSERRTVKINTIPKADRTYIVSNKEHKRITSTIKLPFVLFEPTHLNILSGPPVIRRNYLDGILSVLKNDYSRTLISYQRVLSQRNALLKRGDVTRTELFPWSVRAAHLGGIIAVCRHNLTRRLNEQITDAYRLISGNKDKIRLTYISTVPIDTYESLLLTKIETAYELDLMRKNTSYGPHREDLTIEINDKLTMQSASRGEARSIAIALKSLETEIVATDLDVQPIFLLDDVLSELDERRTKSVLQNLKKYQSLVTTTAVPSDKKVLLKESEYIFLNELW